MSLPTLTVRDRHAPPLAFETVTCRFGDGPKSVTAVDEVSLRLEAGQLTALMGPSGSGKSTLLHLAAGMVRPTSGIVRVTERNVGSMSTTASAEMRRDTVGVVFQAYNLIPTLTAIENVTLPMEFAGAASRADHRSRRRRVDVDRRRRPDLGAGPQ